jgi:hypothetical protein
MADEVKKEADKTKRIFDIERSITKNTSASTAQSKYRQIQSYQNELTRIVGNKAGINKKIADERKKAAEIMVKLQKEESEEIKKAEKKQKSIYDAYERRIFELSAVKTNQTFVSNVATNLYKETNEEEYDVFLSHASEDKETFADELFNELKESSVRVWYDDISISWGDSLRSKIDNGLKKSKYGIVIISKDYIRKGWTQYELDGLFQIEMTQGKIILPIWHNITKKEVQEFSPTLAGRKALNSSMMTPEEIANELINILKMQSTKETPND